MPKRFKVKQVFQLALFLAVVIWLCCSLGNEAMGHWSWSLEKEDFFVGEDGEKERRKRKRKIG
jgi:hypothetical protein